MEIIMMKLFVISMFILGMVGIVCVMAIMVIATFRTLSKRGNK